MDPNATLRIILDEDSTPSESIDAVHDLSEWICRGGFFPSGPDMDRLASLSWDDACSDELREASTQLAALRVALFYGDFSGLQGLGFEVIR
jgi:hypothetical protein